MTESVQNIVRKQLHFFPFHPHICSSPPLILVIPPTAFLLPLPGRDVYFPPSTNLNNYPPHWSRAQIPPCTRLARKRRPWTAVHCTIILYTVQCRLHCTIELRITASS